MAAAAIETDGLSKVYPGGLAALVDLDLTVAPGEVFGFLGPNGAGKTTTIRLLLDLIRPTAGSARLLGLDARADAVAVHREVGYLSGELRMPQRLTGRVLLDWVARLRGGAVDPAWRAELTERFEVQLDRPLHDLSKGNRQKVGILIAFQHRPRLLVLDEPTTGLDPLVQDEFRKLARETAAAGGTVFLSSHSLDEVQHTADRVGVVREGRLVAVEAVETLLARAVRHVSIAFAQPVDPAVFAALAGVTGVVAEGSHVRMQVHGAMDAVVKRAAEHELIDLVAEPADLEELFLDWFRRREGPDAA